MSYQSPFSTRYASNEMRAIWSEKARRILWRRVWIAVAEAQAAAGLVTPEQIEDLKSQATNIDLGRAHEIESEIGHDLVAELRTFAEQCPQGGPILHWGMTSADVKDNADILRQHTALTLLLRGMRKLLLRFADQMHEFSDLPVMGYTHLQPAEPTTLGFRLAVYAQDLAAHFENLARLRKVLKGKGIRGSVGTAATFTEMLQETEHSADLLEQQAMDKLGISFFPISGQTYPRIQDYMLLSYLAALAASLHKFALDLRFLQSRGINTMEEPFAKMQVGSSAMPFKRNPIRAEKICSLARGVQANATVAWQNAANSILENTLDDSANRRRILPEAFLACDEMLLESFVIVDGLVVDEEGIREILDTYGGFSATERLLNALVQAGADRQKMHERLRKQSMKAWKAVRKQKTNPLVEILSSDTKLLKYLQPTRIRELMEIRSYLGFAPQRARDYASQIRETYSTSENSIE